MIENEYIRKLLEVPGICGWKSITVELEAVGEEGDAYDNQIYVASDIHQSKIDEVALYSSLHAIISDAEDIFGDLLLDSEVLENPDEDVAPYRLVLRVSTNTHETRPQEEE